MVSIDPRKLRSLATVAENGTVTSAAESLGYSPSAISQHISGLERDLGVDLIRQSGRNVELTDAGRALVAESSDVFAALAKAETAAMAAAGEVTGTVRVGSFHSPSVQLIPRAVQEFTARHPDAHVHLTIQDTSPSIRQLGVGDLDIVVVQRYPAGPAPTPHDTDVHVLLEDEILLAVHPTTPASATLSDFRKSDWILPDPSNSICSQIVIDRCRKHGFEPLIAYSVPDYAVALGFAAAGLGVAAASMLAQNEPSPSVHYLHLEPPLLREISATTRRGAQRPAVSAFIETLGEVASALWR